ncbi:MAG: hypothetical protein HY289_09110 [Planctomycetes bacterium]|nr:hypothetical protein [Planctomycetota bacterium]
MMSAVRNRAMLALVILCAFAAPGRGDEVDYLPDGCFFYFSGDVAAFRKSKLYQEATKQIKEFERGFNDMRDRLGVPVDNIARLSVGVMNTDGPSGEVGILTTLKPIKAADILAAKKGFPFQKDYTHKEVKVGKHTLYEENYRFEFDKDATQPVKGQAFCVVEEKIVLFGRLEGIRKVLERDKKPVFSPGVAAGIKEAGMKDALLIVFDFSGFPEKEKDRFKRDLDRAFPGAEAVFDSLQTLTVRGNATDAVKATARLTCKNKTAEADVKKAVNAGMDQIKGFLAENPTDPPEVKKAKTEVRAALAAVALSAQDAQVTAEVSIDAATAVRTLESLLVPKKVEKKFKDFKDDKK